MADNVVRCLKDLFSAAVVFLQTDGATAFELLLKGENVLDGRAAETVNTLVIVTDYADVPVFASQK